MPVAMPCHSDAAHPGPQLQARCCWSRPQHNHVHQSSSRSPCHTHGPGLRAHNVNRRHRHRCSLASSAPHCLRYGLALQGKSAVGASFTRHAGTMRPAAHGGGARQGAIVAVRLTVRWRGRDTHEPGCTTPCVYPHKPTSLPQRIPTPLAHTAAERSQHGMWCPGPPMHRPVLAFTLHLPGPQTRSTRRPACESTGLAGGSGGMEGAQSVVGFIFPQLEAGRASSAVAGATSEHRRSAAQRAPAPAGIMCLHQATVAARHPSTSALICWPVCCARQPPQAPAERQRGQRHCAAPRQAVQL